MKTQLIRQVGTSLALTFMALLANSVSAQNMHMYGNSNVVIEDASITASRLNGTDFGALNTNAQEQWRDFWILNTDDQVDLEFTGPVTVTGDNPADFTILEPTGPVNDNTHVPVRVTFNPTAVGTRTAIITIPNNTPGSKENFSFVVRGEGIAGLPTATPDISVSGYKYATKAKLNKKTGIVTTKWKVEITNEGVPAIQGGLLKFYYSENETLSLSDDLVLAEIQLKPMAAPIPGKKPKIKKAKLKAEVPTSAGYIFAVATLLPLFPAENNQDQNVTWDSYDILF